MLQRPQLADVGPAVVESSQKFRQRLPQAGVKVLGAKPAHGDQHEGLAFELRVGIFVVQDQVDVDVAGAILRPATVPAHLVFNGAQLELEFIGQQPGLDLDGLVRAGQWISDFLGRKSNSRAGNAIAVKLREADESVAA